MTTVLVIEDDDIILEIIAETLEFAGYEVFTAQDGSEGITLAHAKKPHLILCDVMMPDTDGYTVLKEIRQTMELARTYFIFLTAKVTKDDIAVGMKLGADDYIVKPFTANTLLDTVKALLEN